MGADDHQTGTGAPHLLICAAIHAAFLPNPSDYRIATIVAGLVAFMVGSWAITESNSSLGDGTHQFLAASVAFLLYAALTLRFFWSDPLISRRGRFVAQCLRAADVFCAAAVIGMVIWSLAMRGLDREVLLAPIWTCLVCGILFRFVSRRYRIMGWSSRNEEEVQKAVDLSTSLAFAGVFLAMAAMVLWFTFNPLGAGTFFGTLGIGFLALAGWSAIATIVWVFLPKSLRVGTWAVVPVVWLTFFATAPDHSQRSTEGNAIGKEEKVPSFLPSVLEHQELYGKCKDSEAATPGGQKFTAESPRFIVAAAGGGLRAAYWTATLLACLDDATCGRFMNHVIAASGVSGGSLGLASYLNHRRARQEDTSVDTGTTDRCAGRAAYMRSWLGRDFLAPTAGYLLFSSHPLPTAANAVARLPLLLRPSTVGAEHRGQLHGAAHDSASRLTRLGG